MREDKQTPMVQAKSLRKVYGATQAVQDISFEVSRGEVVGFLGPNGAGKTTTMKMLTGFLRPTFGSALIGGIDVGEDARALGAGPDALHCDVTLLRLRRYCWFSTSV